MSQAPEGPPGPTAMRRFGPLAVMILVAQLVVAWVLIQALLVPEDEPVAAGDQMMAQAPMGQVETGGTEADEPRELPFYYTPPKLHRIIVNPAGTRAERVLMTSIQLGLKAFDRSKTPPVDITGRLGEEAELLAILDRYASRMRAVAITCLGHHTVAELEGPNRAALSDEMRTCLNDEVLRPAFPAKTFPKHVVVEDVVFTDFVIQ